MQPEMTATLKKKRKERKVKKKICIPPHQSVV